ncbi:glycine betaine ABC transporter substrate-binding protein [Microlunatus soli]|uniref:Glycine betaine/proline transport system substrate-binding protein n=1 Tax=Microlunatus soli TaxID=630515 RepID=A0A1H1W5S8_9ACTN|nr:glycine betaine ABC transporter substrate-binding protein [Microlunatus soli]SDS91826.1 glycine betaine/proline transport system substrate-binding protein [Microlunatus soli]
MTTEGIHKARTVIVAMAAATALLVSGCSASNTGGQEVGGGSSDKGSGDIASKYADCQPGEGVKDTASMKIGADEDKKITITKFAGWADGAANAHLMKAILDKAGYQTEVKTLDAAPAYTAVAQGNYDVITDAELPSTHKAYINKYGDKLEPQGCWYDNPTIEIAVPTYSPAKSIGDLKTMAGKYNNEIIGIEDGAGETQTMQDSTIPKYGLQDLEFKTSSSAAMLRALDTAYKQKKNVAVTLWTPHWAYQKYDLRKLEDPKKAMSAKEGLWDFTRTGFGKDHPLAAQLMHNMVLDEDQMVELESVMVEKYGDKNPDKAVAEWLSKHPDFVDKVASGGFA